MKSGEIKQIIKDSGLTISAISRKIGVSRKFMQKLSVKRKRKPLISSPLFIKQKPPK